MPDALKVAILSFCGSAILTIGTALFSWWRERRAGIQATITVHEFKPPSTVKRLLEQEAHDPETETANRRLWFGLGGAEAYVKLALKNDDTKRMTAVTVTMNDFGCLAQIDDNSEIQDIARGQRLAVGDLQPGHTTLVHLWYGAGLAYRTVEDLRKMLTVSADEISRVVFKFPMPLHARRALINKAISYTSLAC